MDIDRIVYKGETAKFKVTISHADFDQLRDNYIVELQWGMTPHSVKIPKSKMIVDEDNDAYMIFESTSMLGQVKAICRYDVPDTDMASGYRKEVDIQWLCFVSEAACPRFACDCKCGGDGHVTYERVYRGDTNTLYLNLRTSEQEPILDSDGKQLRVHKSDDDLI